jgi:hypothetical protein
MNLRTQTLGLFLAAPALSAGLLFGQATNSADVTGTVTDTTGAVVPGVKVAVKDIDKGIERDITTNGAGAYDSGPIVANDRYTITFSREGFQSLQRGPMVLQVGQIGLNVQLAVGQTTQQVVVNEEAPLLQTTSAELSTTISTDTLQTLPQTGNPDWQSFVVLQPGVSGNGGTGTGNPGMGQSAANGSMPFSTAMLDGSTISSPMSDNVINTPIFETIGEVKMSTSNFSAQYGTGGIIYNQISKGGSNTWHGEAYDYFQNNALNAASYGFGTGRIPVIRYNDYGFQGSGPVIKNKIFLLFDWDRRIQHGTGSLAYATLPTDAMRTGDFTGLPTIYDPTTQVVSGTTVTRTSFADEYGNGNKIPAGMIDQVAKNIQALYPSYSGAFSTNDYPYLSPASISDEQKLFGRFDANPTSKDHLDGSSAYNYPAPVNRTTSILTTPVNIGVIDVENMSGQLSWVHTFSPTMINEARAGWMGEYDLLKSPTEGQGWPAKLGLQYAKADVFPSISITNYYGLNAFLHANYRENIFSYSDVVTMIRGRHTLHLGGEFDAYRADSTAWGNLQSATLGFTGVYTQAGNTKATEIGGDPYADFLLGYVQNWNALVSPTYYGRQKLPSLFIQDDMKVTPRLTLNLGLRWEGRTGWTDSSKNMRSFDTTITNPATNKPGAMWYAFTHTNGRTQLEKNQWNNWLPRFGFNWQFYPKMTFSGGFGMYTFPWNVDQYASCCMGNALSSSGNERDSTGNIDPVAFLSGTGNENPQGAKGASINSLYVHSPLTPEGYNGHAVSYILYDQPIPLLYNWNLTVQRQLTPNLMAQVGYVGSHGTNLVFTNDIDQVPVSLLGPGDASSRPYPEYQGITGFNTDATSVYHAFQAQIARRFSNGLMLNFNYTWSHMTDDQDSSGWGTQEGTRSYQNSYDPRANWGAANFDVRNMFKAYGAYDLPFGHGRKYLNNSKALDEAIGGWTMSLTFVGQGGHPFTPVMAVDNSFSLAGGDFKWYPNQVGNPKTSGSSGTIQQWFNDAPSTTDPDAFGAYHVTPGTLGNMRRNSVYGPGLHVINGSIHKTFPIWERVSFDLAANATNLINHPSFANPDANIGPGHHAQITGVNEGGRTVELVGKIRF